MASKTQYKLEGHVELICATMVKGAKGTISLVQAKDVVSGPNCMLKSLWG